MLGSPPVPRPAQPAGGTLLAGPGAAAPPGIVPLPGHGAPGGGHGQHQRVRIGHAQGGSHLLLFLEEQLVLFPSGPAVQFHPDRGQDGPGVVDGHGVHVVGQDRNGQHQRRQRRHIPQPAVGLLEIGLEQEPDVAVRPVPFGHQPGQHPQPGRLLLHPAVAGALQHRFGHLGVAADDPSVEQAQGHPQVLTRHVQGFTRPSYAVVQRDALVPYRVPDLVGGGRDIGLAPVDEHDVEIAERTQLAPAVAAHRHQSDAASLVAGGLVEQFGQPRIGGPGVGVAERIPPQVVTLDERLPHGAQGHGRTVPPPDQG